MSEFEFKDVLFIGPADNSEDSWASKCFVNHLLNNKVKVCWQPYSKSPKDLSPLDLRLKKVKNILLNHKQVIVDSSVENWDFYFQKNKSFDRLKIGIFRDEIFEVNKVNSSEVDLVFVLNSEVKKELIKNKCTKQILILPFIKVIEDEEEENLNESIESCLTLDENWYDLEKSNNRNFRWVDNICSIIVNSKDFDYLSLQSINEFSEKNISIYTKKISKETFDLVKEKKFKVNELIDFKVDIKSVCEVKIVCDGKSLKELDLASDKRRLNFKLEKVTLYKSSESYEVPIEKIKDQYEIIYNNLASSKQLITKPDFLFKYGENEYLKKINISSPLKHGIILYLEDLNSSTKKCLKNLFDFKRSQNDIDLVIFSDKDLTLPKEYDCRFIKIEDDYDKVVATRWPKPDTIAFWGFIQSLEIAEELGWDYFFCYEWDCKVGKDNWYDILWDECLSWQEEPILMGTPVFKLPPRGSSNILQASMDYRYNYAKQCGVNMLVEMTMPYCLYTNGALTFYNVKYAKKYYQKELSLNRVNRSLRASVPAPWDVDIGIKIFKDQKGKSMNKIGWLPSAYSGCTDVYYNKKQRDLMLESGLKVAVHQYKYK